MPAAAIAGLSAASRLLVVAPHPDDETLACGQLLQQVLAAGGTVHVLLLSDGDNNPWPQRWVERRLRVGTRAARSRWGARRRREWHAALDVLGVPSTGRTALGWPDQGLTRLLEGPGASAALAELGTVLAGFAPTLVAMPALDDRHPDHGAAHVLCRLAMHASGCSPGVLCYRIHGPMPPAGEGAWLLPADGPGQQRKRHALACHRSQLALSARRMAAKAARPERFLVGLPTPGDDRLPWRPARLAWPVLRLTQAGRGSWPWRLAPWCREPDGGYRLPARSGAAVPAPRFVKLACRWRTPWIFDHWGWHELR